MCAHGAHSFIPAQTTFVNPTKIPKEAAVSVGCLLFCLFFLKIIFYLLFCSRQIRLYASVETFQCLIPFKVWRDVQYM